MADDGDTMTTPESSSGESESPDLEMPVAWEKHHNNDDMQLFWTLVSYGQG